MIVSWNESVYHNTGLSKISMMTTLIGAVINVILDPIFIFVFDMGVRGAAIATVLSQAVGAIWVLRFLTGEKTILKLKLSNMKRRPEGVWTVSCTWYFKLCNDFHREPFVNQLYIKSIPLWR